MTFKSNVERAYQNFIFKSIANALVDSDQLKIQLATLLRGLRKDYEFRCEQEDDNLEKLQVQIDNTISLIRLRRHIDAAIKKARSERLI